jgi:hypothetical protein
VGLLLAAVGYRLRSPLRVRGDLRALRRDGRSTGAAAAEASPAPEGNSNERRERPRESVPWTELVRRRIGGNSGIGSASGRRVRWPGHPRRCKLRGNRRLLAGTASRLCRPAAPFDPLSGCRQPAAGVCR